MSDVLVQRPARTPPTHARPQPVRLADPPAGGDPARIANWTYALFPVLGSAGILVFATVSGNPIYFLAGGVFVIGALGMGIAMYVQTRGRSQEQTTDDRLRYFEHLAEAREALRAAEEVQRRRAVEQHPEPCRLLGLIDRPDRLWERRPDDADHLLVRVGRGLVRNEAAPDLPGTDPGSPREHACEVSARRLIERLGWVPDVPVGAPLGRGVTVLAGPGSVCRPLARAMVAQIAVQHTPDDVRLAVCCPDPAARPEWEWVKWLPHARNPAGGGHDGTGLMLAEDATGLITLLDAELERRRRSTQAPGTDRSAAAAAGPALVVLVDGVPPAPDPLLELDGLDVAVLRIVPGLDVRPPKVDLTLLLRSDGGLDVEVRRDRDGVPMTDAGDLAPAQSLPALPGRAVVSGGHKAQIAEPALLVSGRPEPVAESGRRIAESWTGPVAPPIRMLPLSVRLDELCAAPGAAPEPGAPFGVREADLRPARIDMFDGRDPHLLVFGDAASGRTATLRTLLTSVCAEHSPERVRVIVVDYRRGLLDVVGPDHLSVYCGSAPSAERTLAGLAERMSERLPGPDVTVAQLRARNWWTGARIVVVVDDYELVATPGGDPLAPLLELLPQGREIGLHVVVARSTSGSGAASLQPVLRRLRELGTPGLLLSGSRDEGPLVHGVRPAPLPVGRAQHVTRAYGSQLVQVAWTPEPGGE